MRLSNRRAVGLLATLWTLIVPPAKLRAQETPTAWNWQLVSMGVSPGNNDPRYLLPSLFAASTNDVYLAGCYRCLYRWDGTNFSAQTQPAGSNRYTVIGAPNGAIYSAGQYTYQTGNLLRFDGSSWTTVLQTPEELFSTYIANDGNVFVIGDGTFYRDSGSGFNAIPTGLRNAWNTDRLLALTGFSSRDVFMGGYYGRIMRYDGETVTTMNSGVTAAIIAMDGTSSENLFAIGERGTVLRFNGTEWTQLPSLGSGTLSGLKALGANDVLVSGEDGLLARWNGTSWQFIDVGTTNRLGSISTPDGGKTIFIAEVTSADVRFRLGTATDSPSTTVPEPGSAALLAISLAGLMLFQLKRAKRTHTPS